MPVRGLLQLQWVHAFNSCSLTSSRLTRGAQQQAGQGDAHLPPAAEPVTPPVPLLAPATASHPQSSSSSSTRGSSVFGFRAVASAPLQDKAAPAGPQPASPETKAIQHHTDAPISIVAASCLVRLLRVRQLLEGRGVTCSSTSSSTCRGPGAPSVAGRRAAGSAGAHEEVNPRRSGPLSAAREAPRFVRPSPPSGHTCFSCCSGCLQCCLCCHQRRHRAPHFIIHSLGGAADRRLGQVPHLHLV